jgi:hypothetical protein
MVAILGPNQGAPQALCPAGSQLLAGLAWRYKNRYRSRSSSRLGYRQVFQVLEVHLVEFIVHWLAQKR